MKIGNKKLLGVVVLVAVLAIAAWGYFSSTKNQTLNTQPNYNPSNPSFIVGNVVIVGPGAIDISAAGKTYKVQINPNTRLTKQTMVNGTMSVVDAGISDFAIGSTVGVTFESGGVQENTSDLVIENAVKIQIIK